MENTAIIHKHASFGNSSKKWLILPLTFKSQLCACTSGPHDDLCFYVQTRSISPNGPVTPHLPCIRASSYNLALPFGDMVCLAIRGY
eukprot:683420-Amphidinium_carterae.1